MSDANRNGTQQTGDKCIYDCISDGDLTSSVYFAPTLLLSQTLHLTIRSGLSSYTLSILFGIDLSLCFRFSIRHLRPRSTNHTRCTSCGFNTMASIPCVIKPLSLLNSGQVAILFCCDCTNLLLRLEHSLL